MAFFMSKGIERTTKYLCGREMEVREGNFERGFDIFFLF